MFFVLKFAIKKILLVLDWKKGYFLFFIEYALAMEFLPDQVFRCLISSQEDGWRAWLREREREWVIVEE